MGEGPADAGAGDAVPGEDENAQGWVKSKDLAPGNDLEAQVPASDAAPTQDEVARVPAR